MEVESTNIVFIRLREFIGLWSFARLRANKRGVSNSKERDEKTRWWGWGGGVCARA